MRNILALFLIVSFTAIAAVEYEEDRMDIFSYGPSGAGANYTPMMKLIIAYSKNRDAESDFHLLTTMHNVNIRLYGLVGLKIIGSKRYAECKELLLKSDETVLCATGCRVNKDSVRNIVNDIDNSKLSDFLGTEDVPNQSVRGARD